MEYDGIYDEILEIRVCLDGDTWCALIGENLQVGIAGFGDSPLNALDSLVDALRVTPCNMRTFALS